MCDKYTFIIFLDNSVHMLRCLYYSYKNTHSFVYFIPGKTYTWINYFHLLCDLRLDFPIFFNTTLICLDISGYVTLEDQSSKACHFKNSQL